MIRLPKAWESDSVAYWRAVKAEAEEPRDSVEVTREGRRYRVELFRNSPESVSVIYGPARTAWRDGRGRRIWHAAQGKPGPVPAAVIAEALNVKRGANTP